MPVLNRKIHEKLILELEERFNSLMAAFSQRELKSPSEGAKGYSHWVHPENFTATIGDESSLRMAVDDFKTILSEIRRIK